MKIDEVLYDIAPPDGAGSWVWDGDGNQYIDGLIGSGPMSFGDRHPAVKEAVIEQRLNGVTFLPRLPKALNWQRKPSTPCASHVLPRRSWDACFE